MQQGPRRRGGDLVAAQQFRRPGKELRKPPATHVFQRVGELPVALVRQLLRDVGRGIIKAVRERDLPPCQQLPHLEVHVFNPGFGQSVVNGGVLRPQSAQNQDRPTLAVGEQRGQGGSDQLPNPLTGAKVVLGFVQPHDRARGDVRDISQGCFGAIRIERMPQSPSPR